MAGCSSILRQRDERLVALTISTPTGVAVTRAEIEHVYAVMRPEFAKYGRELTTDRRAAGALVYVTDPADPLGAMGGRITFVRLPLSGQTYAISVSTTDGSPPTPAQTAHIYREIERRGYSVDPNPRFASGMMAVRFEPDASGVGGLVSIVALQNKEANSASASRELKEQSDRALREMVREPKE